MASNTATLAANVGLDAARDAEWEVVRKMGDVVAAWREDGAETRRGLMALLARVEEEALRRQVERAAPVVTASGTEIPRPRTTPEKPAAGVPLIPHPRAALRLVQGAGPGTTARGPVSTPPVPAPGRAVKRAAPVHTPWLAVKRAAPVPTPWLVVKRAAPVPAPRLAVKRAAPVPAPRLAVKPAGPVPAPRLAVKPAAPVPAPRLAVKPAAPVPAPRLAVRPALPVSAPRRMVQPASPAAPVPAWVERLLPVAPVPAVEVPGAPVPSAPVPAAPVPSAPVPASVERPLPVAPVLAAPVPAALSPQPLFLCRGRGRCLRPLFRRPLFLWPLFLWPPQGVPCRRRGRRLPALEALVRWPGRRRPPTRPPERLRGWAGVLSWSVRGGSRSGRMTPWPEIGDGGMWRRGGWESTLTCTRGSISAGESC